MVGRVDLANLPGRLCSGGPATFPSECELLRNYLKKDHRFRTGQFNLTARRGRRLFRRAGRRGLCRKRLAQFRGVFRFCQRQHSPTRTDLDPGPGDQCLLVGLRLRAGDLYQHWRTRTANPYNDGVSTDLVRADVKAVFTLMFGSWLGDWDSEDDLQRSILATPSYGLTCAWSGRPHWFLQHMALGAPIGFSTRLTQNNRLDGLYHNQQNNGASQIHIALMGDPTLRMHVVAPPTHLTATRTGSDLELRWQGSDDTVVGYPRVPRRTSQRTFRYA